jgi:hypothetical protein
LIPRKVSVFLDSTRRVCEKNSFWSLTLRSDEYDLNKIGLPEASNADTRAAKQIQKGDLFIRPLLLSEDVNKAISWSQDTSFYLRLYDLCDSNSPVLGVL